MTLTARYVPTGGGLQVGGDWYDVIDLPSGRTALVVGDVQGHDVRAAGVMGQLRIALRAYAAEGHRPDAVMSRTSRFLAGLTECSAESEDARFATCLYMEVDPVDGTLDVVRAGHLDPVVRLADGTTIVRRTAGGLPLGIAPDSDYPTTRLTLEPGETMLICTDGLIETGGHDLDSGFQRLRPVLEDAVDDGLEALADALVEMVHGLASHHLTGPLADRREDDVALLLVRRDPVGAQREAPVRRSVLTVAQTDARQLRAAREEVRALLHDWTSGDQVDAAVLLVSELVTNVLLHTDDDAVLGAQLLGVPGVRRLRVDVTDRSDGMPHRRTPGEMAASGRGLLLLQEIADAWGWIRWATARRSGSNSTRLPWRASGPIRCVPCTATTRTGWQGPRRRWAVRRWVRATPSRHRPRWRTRSAPSRRARCRPRTSRPSSPRPRCTARAVTTPVSWRCTTRSSR